MTERSHYENTLKILFERARSTDEFEFACALMRIRGAEAAGWDTLYESNNLYNDLTALLETPLISTTKARLALLLYCHIVEADPIHVVLGNMLRVIVGDRCSIDPFHDLYRKKGPLQHVPPSLPMKLKRIKELEQVAGSEELSVIVDRVYNDPLRNAFFHSDYSLYDGELRSRGSWFTHADGIRSQVMTQDELRDQVNAGIAFFQAFMVIYQGSIRSYKVNKEILGHLHGTDNPPVQVRLLCDSKYGLYGFESV